MLPDIANLTPMFCESCGAQAGDNASFCGSCGKPINPSTPQAPAPSLTAPRSDDFAKRKRVFIIVGIAFGVAAFMTVAVIAVMYYQWNKMLTAEATVELNGSCETDRCVIRVSNESGELPGIARALWEVPSVSKKFTVPNFNNENYAIEVRDLNDGDAYCTATVTFEGKTVEDKGYEFRGTEAFCMVGTPVR